MALGSIRSSMKTRLLAMGSIISVLGLGLLATRGIGIAYAGLLLVGLALLVLGLFWKK